MAEAAPERTPALDRLLAAARAAVAANGEFARFAGDLLDAPFAQARLPAGAGTALPVLARLDAIAARAGPETAPLAKAIVAAAPDLRWRQSYTEAEVGARFLEGYGWANLVAPTGPFVSPRCRLSIGVWEAGLAYPPHAHAPAEIYFVVAGGAVFGCEGRPERRLGPGETWEHPPGIVHWARMEGTPLLAMALWTGAEDSLTRNPDLLPPPGSPA